MQEPAQHLFPSSDDIWYAGQLKAFAARLPAVASRYDLLALTVLQVQVVALEFMELLIQRMHCAAEYSRGQQHTAAVSWLPPEPTVNWQKHKVLAQELVQELVGHIKQHAAYTAADELALGLAPLAGQAACLPNLASPQ